MVQMELPFGRRVEENRGSTFTTAELSGETRSDVERTAEQYLKDFHPAGYSTRIVYGPNQEGAVWKMKLSRYSSSSS